MKQSGGNRFRSWLPPAGLVLAATVVLGPAAPHAAGAAPGAPAARVSVPDGITGAASAVAMRGADRKNPPVLPAGLEAADQSTGSAQADMDGTSASASASAYSPGSAIANGPGLFCSQALDCPFAVPAYPLAARASYPVHPDDAAGGAGTPLTQGDGAAVQPVGAQAHAHPGDASSSGATATASLGGGAFGSGAQQAGTHLRYDGRALRVTATATSAGLTAGPLRIGGVDAASTVVVPLQGKPTADTTVQVTGLNLGGTPLTLDAAGLHVAGSDAPLPPALAQQLGTAGVSIRLLGDTRSTGPNRGAAGTGGVLVTVATTVAGVPPLQPPGGGDGLPTDAVPVPVPNPNGDDVVSVVLGVTAVTGQALPDVYGGEDAPGAGSVVAPPVGGSRSSPATTAAAAVARGGGSPLPAAPGSVGSSAALPPAAALPPPAAAPAAAGNGSPGGLLLSELPLPLPLRLFYLSLAVLAALALAASRLRPRLSRVGHA